MRVAQTWSMLSTILDDRKLAPAARLRRAIHVFFHSEHAEAELRVALADASAQLRDASESALRERPTCSVSTPGAQAAQRNLVAHAVRFALPACAAATGGTSLAVAGRTRFRMPFCATRHLSPFLLVVAIGTAASGCNESAPTAQAQPEGMHLTPGLSTAAVPEAQAGAARGDQGSAGAPGSTSSSAAAARVGAAGGFAPAGSSAPPPGPSLPVAGTLAEAGSGAAGGPSDHLRVPIRDPNSYGGNACSSTSIEQFIARAQQLRPELADIRELAHVDSSPGMTSISAYLEADFTLTLVFRRGDGDCAAGCIDNEYWYFKSDDACAPRQAGYYKRADDPNRNCYVESGAPLWNEPRPLDPKLSCGANLTPQDVSGSHQLRARGVVQACARSGESIAPMSIDELIKLDVMQDSAQPSHATITLHGVGHALLDDRKLNADVVRRQLSVHVSDNQPGNCIKQSQLDLSYDFEGLAERRLFLMQVDTPDCSQPNDYCKGYVELSLGEP